MSADLKQLSSNQEIPAWHGDFLKMMPAIRRQAQISFRKAPPELRGELVAEVVANCLAAYARLLELGKQHVAFPSALGRYAVAQVRAGRRVGNRLRVREVLSNYAQHRKGFSVERLDYFDEEENCWREIIVEDKRATPAEVAAFRLDFLAWLKLLPQRRRKIALTLAAGETTLSAAKQFGVAPSRISQLRKWFQLSWERFQGDVPVGACCPLRVA
ncbi:MAG TPA: hypothetical protein VGY55_04975 [Pirellulales bacterium]|jgi:hypothetical protein|nr:hypothetical protein [Pirellulales bacterium]